MTAFGNSSETNEQMKRLGLMRNWYGYLVKKGCHCSPLLPCQKNTIVVSIFINMIFICLGMC